MLMGLKLIKLVIVMFKLNIHKKIKPILKMDQILVFYTGRGHVCIDLVPHRYDMFNANVYNIWPVTLLL